MQSIKTLKKWIENKLDMDQNIKKVLRPAFSLGTL